MSEPPPKPAPPSPEAATTVARGPSAWPDDTGRNAPVPAGPSDHARMVPAPQMAGVVVQSGRGASAGAATHGTTMEGLAGRLTLRARLALWNVVLLLGLVGAMLAVLYIAFEETALQQLDAHVEEELIEFRNIARAPDAADAWRRVIRDEARPNRRKFFSIRIRDDMDREVVVSGVFRRPAWRFQPLPEDPAPLTIEGGPTTLDAAPATGPSDDDDGAWRLFFERLTTADGRAYRLHLAVDLAYLQAYARTFNWVVLLAVAGLLLAGSSGAWWVAGRSLRPLTRIADRMQRVGLRSLEERLTEPVSPDEIGRLVISFNGMLDRLQLSVERLRQFTSDAAHELRTPVAAALTAVEVALSQVRTADGYRRTLDSLLPALEQLARLGRDMGTLAEADEDRMRLELSDADADRLAEEAVEFLQPLAEDRGLTLAWRPGQAGMLRCDVPRLRQVLFNLLENAVKYTVAGGITVAVEGDARAVRFRVSDTGPGIAPEHLRRLFDRFYRVDRDRNRRTGGSGLGLAICRALVEAHGGRLSVRSRLGEGSEFTAELPRVPGGAGGR